MKTKIKLITVNIITLLVIAIFSFAVVSKANADDIQLPSKDIQSDEINPLDPVPMKQTGPESTPKMADPTIPIAPLLNMCTKCIERCVWFKGGESYRSYCTGMCRRSGECSQEE